jgi:ElaB/YqjD/DUF883 family membrane-anchored ribosome-binding protein
MPTTNEKHTDVEEHVGNRFSADLEMLQNSFAQLREDVTSLLNNAVDTAKSGAGAIKHRGNESVERVSETIGEQPILSTAIAFTAGFVVAKLFSRK